MQLERALGRARRRITEFQLKEQAARLGPGAIAALLTDTADLEAVEKSIADGNVRVQGLRRAKIDRLHREIAALGAINLAALDELNLARETKVFLDAQTARPDRGHEHAGRRDPQDRRRNAQLLSGHVSRR